MPRSWILKISLLVIVFLLAACDMRLNPYALNTRTVNLNLGRSPVTFDDLSYDPKLAKVIVPAAESGALALVDPLSGAAQVITGFDQPVNPGVPVTGITSATAVRGTIFAVNKAARAIEVIDPQVGKVINSVPVQDQPDYIHYVSAVNELWITEQAIGQIEVFSLDRSQPPQVQRSIAIPVPNGPEGLLIDQSRGLAYTNEPKTGSTAVINVQTHNVLFHWSNGCTKARGLALDEARGYLFVACNEGKLVLMDINNNGEQITSASYGGGLDSVAYNPQLKHVYIPSAASGLVAVFEVAEIQAGTPVPGRPTATASTLDDSTSDSATPTPGPAITLKWLGTADTALKARCVATDDHNNIWVCDPDHGGLFMIKDTFPAGN